MVWVISPLVPVEEGKIDYGYFDVIFTEKMAPVACLPYCAVGMRGNSGLEGMLSVRVGPQEAL